MENKESFSLNPNKEYLTDIREYGEGDDVLVQLNDKHKRFEVIAFNECGYDATGVDLEDVLIWAAKTMPDMFKQVADKYLPQKKESA